MIIEEGIDGGATGFWARFKTGAGTIVRSTLRANPAGGTLSFR
jgi:hypothetical protein